MDGAFGYDPRWRELDAYGPELRQGPAVEVGDRIRDVVPKDYQPLYDRAAAPFRAISGYVAKPIARGVDTLAHPGDKSTSELAMGALDASGAVPAGAFGAAGKAMFMAPLAIKRLGLYQGGKGTIEALNHARNAWSKGDDPAQVWADTGWAHPGAFGHADSEPVTWRPQDGLWLREGPMDKVPFSYAFDNSDEIIRAAGGIDPPVTVTIDPKYTSSGGGYGQRSAQAPWEIAVDAKNQDGAHLIGRHEAQHFIRHAADPETITFAKSREGSIRGTRAEQILSDYQDKLFADTRQLAERYNTLPPGHPESMQLAQKMETIGGDATTIPSAITQVRDFAGYAASPHELEARIASGLYKDGNGYPGAMFDAIPYPGNAHNYAYSASAFAPAFPFKNYLPLGYRLRDLMRPK